MPGVDAVLCESVVATIEVKSTLTCDAFAESVRAARITKAVRERSPFLSTHGEWCPEKIPCFVVAFTGPKHIGTLHRWAEAAYIQQGIVHPEMSATLSQRGYASSPALDGIYVMGTGVLQYDTLRPTLFDDDARRANPTAKWLAISAPDDVLLWLFLTLTLAGVAGGHYNFNPTRYVQACDFEASLL